MTTPSKKPVANPDDLVDPKDIQDPKPDDLVDPKPSDSVSYESHQRLLGEKKAMQAKLRAFEDAAASKDLKDAENNQNFQQANDLLKEKVADYETKFAKQTEQNNNAKKYLAFKSSMKEFNDDLVDLVDISQIQLDPDTGEVDKFSLEKYTKGFKTKYGKYIVQPERNNLPNDAPTGDKAGKLTYEQWLQLPAKEMAGRKKDVIE